MDNSRITAFGEDGAMLLIRTRRRNYSLRTDEIYFAENRLKKIVLHTAREQIELYASMHEVEELVGKDFYRSHRGYLVNMAHISSYESDTIRFPNGEEAYLARDRAGKFVRAYEAYLAGRGPHLPE